MYGGKLRLVMALEKKLLKIPAIVWSSSIISSASLFSSFSIKVILSFVANLLVKSGLTELQKLLLSHSV